MGVFGKTSPEALSGTTFKLKIKIFCKAKSVIEQTGVMEESPGKDTCS